MINCGHINSIVGHKDICFVGVCAVIFQGTVQDRGFNSIHVRGKCSNSCCGACQNQQDWVNANLPVSGSTLNCVLRHRHIRSSPTFLKVLQETVASSNSTKIIWIISNSLELFANGFQCMSNKNFSSRFLRLAQSKFCFQWSNLSKSNLISLSKQGCKRRLELSQALNHVMGRPPISNNISHQTQRRAARFQSRLCILELPKSLSRLIEMRDNGSGFGHRSK